MSMAGLGSTSNRALYILSVTIRCAITCKVDVVVEAVVGEVTCVAGAAYKHKEL